MHSPFPSTATQTAPARLAHSTAAIRFPLSSSLPENGSVSNFGAGLVGDCACPAANPTTSAYDAHASSVAVLHMRSPRRMHRKLSMKDPKIISRRLVSRGIRFAADFSPMAGATTDLVNMGLFELP